MRYTSEEGETTISERILLAVSKAPPAHDYLLKDSATTIDSALDLLQNAYPNLRALLSGKRIVDFGCGEGYQSIALVKQFDCLVVGIDTNKATLERAINNAREHNIPSRQLSFLERISPDMLNGFDVVISQDSFEHFGNPERVLDEMAGLLNDAGIALITFGPPWLAPYGNHMHFFCKVPWINIMFSEKTVMNVRGRFRHDGAAKYEEVESGLNKMTVARFENILSSGSLRLASKKYDCVRGINWLSKLPLPRELFINHVSVVLCKAADVRL